MARNTKYDADTFPLLVKKYARDGFTDKEIYQSLGIGKDSFYTYINKHSEFSDALKEGRKPVVAKVEDNFYKRANGYMVEEITTEYVNDDKGNPQIKSKKIVQKHIAPDVGAAIFVLTNKDPENWKQQNRIDVTSKGKEINSNSIVVTPEEIELINKKLEEKY